MSDRDSEATPVRDDQLLRILRIGHDASMRGEGISLIEALRRTGYQENRGQFGEPDLLRLIRANPDLVEQWLSYSEDKRTSGGWYILRNGEVGRVDAPGSSLRFESIEEAVAGYVVRELDSVRGSAD
jgi:hypothetical protein